MDEHPCSLVSSLSDQMLIAAYAGLNQGLDQVVVRLIQLQGLIPWHAHAHRIKLTPSRGGLRDG